MKGNEFHNMTDVELAEKLKELKSELFNLRFRHGDDDRLIHLVGHNDADSFFSKISFHLRHLMPLPLTHAHGSRC